MVFRSSSKANIIRQSSRSQEENVAKMVGATSSEGFRFTVESQPVGALKVHTVFIIFI